MEVNEGRRISIALEKVVRESWAHDACASGAG